MAPIPGFADGYYLPDGEFECTLEEIEAALLSTPERIKVWKLFRNLCYRLDTLGIFPDIMLIDGSFVTGREKPGDVDVCVMVPPEKLEEAFKKLDDDHDKQALVALFANDNQGAVRVLFGAHLLLADDESSLAQWSAFLRTPKDPDYQKDPSWVRKPKAKGILKVKA